ncbi:MDR family MFS transporter [Cohnella thermotolerans]|uniref:MDR family MFS transporter n=1 Tax=Cohnella thermotolerans TaxID=329858 RepID=UPI000405B29E|nr:MFS transporter [Cohnella thermotolerans]
MGRIRQFLQSYHPIVFSLLFGHMISRIATSMSMPFLALYLSSQTDMSKAMIGFVAGAGALAGTFGGFFGGALSDRYGRRVIMFTSLFAWSGVFIGFSAMKEPVLLLILSLLNGLCRSWFEPVAQVLMADLTEPERRFKVFSMRYLMTNIGVSVGPLIGVWLGTGSGALPFLITGLVYLAYGIVLHVMMIAFGIKEIEGAKKERATIASAWKAVRDDNVLQLFILGSIVVGIGYSQLDVTLGQHLQESFRNGVKMFAALMSINAVTVIVMQLPLSRLAEKRPPMFSIHAGNVLFAVGTLGFAFSMNMAALVVSMILFTIGEILNYPAGNLLLDQLAPEHLRGSYFGAQKIGNLGQFIGPWAGGLLLGEFGGRVLFIVMALVLLSASYFYRVGNRKMEAKAN